MKFIVQQNDHSSHDYACIHVSTCSFAKKPGHSTENTSWSELYDTYNEALVVARLSKTEIRNCSFCSSHK